MPRALASPLHQHLRGLLVEARKDAKLTQEQVAERLRRPQSFVSKYEKGERKLDVIEFLAVCSALGISAGSTIEALRRQGPVDLSSWPHASGSGAK